MTTVENDALDAVLTTREVSRILGLSDIKLKRMRKLADCGGLPFVRLSAVEVQHLEDRRGVAVRKCSADCRNDVVATVRHLGGGSGPSDHRRRELLDRRRADPAGQELQEAATALCPDIGLQHDSPPPVSVIFRPPPTMRRSLSLASDRETQTTARRCLWTRQAGSWVVGYTRPTTVDGASATAWARHCAVAC